MQRIAVVTDILDPRQYANFAYVEDIRPYLFEKFNGVWPQNAKLYVNYVAQSHEISIFDKASVEALSKIEGDIYCVVYPQEPATILYAIIALVVVAAIVLRPSIPNAVLRNNANDSSNNQLQGRQNEVRINGRIPCILGQVRSYPDLLNSYILFEDDKELEWSYLCIGEGSYSYPSAEIRDGTTPVSQIEDMVVEVYGPGNNPSVGTVETRIPSGASAITQPVYSVIRSTSIIGQELLAPNSAYYRGSGNITLSKIGANGRVTVDDSDVDLTELFEVGDSLTLGDSVYVDPISGIESSLNGTYTIANITSSQIGLLNANTINPNWSDLPTEGAPDFQSTLTVIDEEKWTGPFDLRNNDFNEVWCNFVAPQNLFTDDGVNQRPLDIVVNLGVVAIDTSSGAELGPWTYYPFTMRGSGVKRSFTGWTQKVTVDPSGDYYFRVKVRRTTHRDHDFDGTISDVVQWRDLYSAEYQDVDYGDVTTVHTQTPATPSALANKDRKLNMLVTRKIPTRISGSTFGSPTATRNAADIFAHVCYDPRIGNRPRSEVDYDSVYGARADAVTLFGTSAVGNFDYTFDKTDITFEETAQLVAQAIFSTAFRQSGKIQLSLEKAQSASSMLFNHRNKIPRTETRTISFGNRNNHDGVELKWVNPEDDSIATFYIPEDRSAVNPQKIETIGVRSYLQAYFHAWRAWNKIRYQNTSVSFEALAESELLIPTTRILVANNTRADTMDGQIEAASGLTLTLSQPVDLDPGEDYTIFLQNPSVVVESRGVVQGANPYQVIIAFAPSFPLVVGDASKVKTVYTIVKTPITRKDIFLLESKEWRNGTYELTAINYASQYYQNDSDYIDGVIE